MSTPKPYDISVTAVAQFHAEQSDAEEGRYVFSYRVTLRNTGSVAAQLLTRHWIITDGDGDVQEVRGTGVIGEQPTLQPGQSFEYTSGCELSTPVGTMHGSYQMVAADGTRFNADIPEFMLAAPRQLH